MPQVGATGVHDEEEVGATVRSFQDSKLFLLQHNLTIFTV
jgi:hypothetical protein